MMKYPTFEEYNQAFQIHSRILSDPELQAGQVTKTGLGLPFAISGGFALTYTIETSSEKKYAVRCFHRSSSALEERYKAISSKLNRIRSPYFVKFEFQPSGIRVGGSAFPVVKMEWANGTTLGEFISDNRKSPSALLRLSNAIISLGSYLEQQRIAHGDLQTGNIMVSDGGAVVQLIDYDGMYLDEIRALGSSELGHVNFQHPQRRSSNPFNTELDRFSIIMIWCALNILARDQTLWDKTNSDYEALIFRSADFMAPSTSSVFKWLSSSKTSDIARKFANICELPVDRIPTLGDFINGNNIRSINIQPTGGIINLKAPVHYIGPYPVVSALDYDKCLRVVGDKVELVGKIVEVRNSKTKFGTPYVFLNFGDWRGDIVKISIWSSGLRAFGDSFPDSSWVGQWISVTGLMEPPYKSAKYKYSHLAITVAGLGQLAKLSSKEAEFRLSSLKISQSPSLVDLAVPILSSSASDVSETLRASQLTKSSASVAFVPSPPVVRVETPNWEVVERIRSLSAGRAGPPPSTVRSSQAQPVVSSSRVTGASEATKVPDNQHKVDEASAVNRDVSDNVGSVSSDVKSAASEKGIASRVLSWLFR